MTLFVEASLHGTGLHSQSGGDCFHCFASGVGSHESIDFCGGELSSAQGDTGAFEDAADSLSVNTELFGELVDGRSGLVSGDEVGAALA